jgi:hypothetical protein
MNMNILSLIVDAVTSTRMFAVEEGVAANTVVEEDTHTEGQPDTEVVQEKAPKVRVHKTRAERAAACRVKAAALIEKAIKLETTDEEVDDEEKPALQYSAGDTIAFLFGRGDKQVEREGKITGIRVPAEGEKGGTVVKVLVGEGYDAEICGVFPSKVLRVLAYADGRPVPVANAAPLDDVDLNLG